MPYKVEIRSLLESLSSSRTLHGEFDASDIELGGQPFSFNGPVTFEVTLTNSGAGIVASGTARATLETPCVRCLCDTRVAMEAEVDGVYVRPGHANEFPEEQEVELIGDDSTIDLEPAIMASVVVELPFAPVHDADCKGICPVCGGDLNITECGCVAPAKPSPFDVLKSFADTDGSVS